MDIWSFPIAYRSTRLGDLYDTDEECAKLMRTIIRGIAQLAFVTGFDVASASAWTHLFNPYTFIVRVEGNRPVPMYQNPIAATGEIGKAFIAYNPEGANVLRDAAEWGLKVAAGEKKTIAALGRMTIWKPEGWIIVEVWGGGP